MAYSLDLQDYVSFDIQASPMEILAPNKLSFRWILDNKALAFVAADATRQTVDAWIEKQLELLKIWNPNRIAFMINSFAAPDCVVTPYARQRLNDILKYTSHIKSLSCTIIARSALAMPVVLLSNAINSTARRQNKSQNMIFYSHDEGVRWLQRRIAEGEFINRTST